MKRFKFGPFAAAIAITASGLFPALSRATSHYAIVDRIAGPDIAVWDYALIDADTRQLFLASGFSPIGGVTALDLDSRHVTAQLVADEKNHGFALLGDGTAMVAEGTYGARCELAQGFGGRKGCRKRRGPCLLDSTM